jgi:hypothetical protein
VLELAIQGDTVNAALDKALTEYRAELTDRESEDVRALTASIDSFLMRFSRLTAKHGMQELFVEQTWAITPDFEACAYDDPAAMIRGIVDLAVLLRSGQLLIVDHKSGRPASVTKYMTQLDVYATMGLSKLPQVTAVQCGVHFLKNEKLDWAAVRTPDYIRTILRPWLRDFLNQRALGLEGYAPSVGRHCAWCDYKQICPAQDQGTADVQGKSG